MTIVVIGSSGGGAATLGHTDPTELLHTINFELSKVQQNELKKLDKDKKSSTYRVKYGLFLSLHGGQGLDSADPLTSMATLYKQTVDDHNSISPIYTGTLKQVNEMYRRLDKEIVTPMIESGEITGVICISCDPTDVNFSSLAAAGKMGIAVTGSGGTSLSAAVVTHGVNLVGNAGGSVATTTHTRAVSYSYALASTWGCKYSPFLTSTDPNGESMERIRPHVRSVLDSCVPAFTAVCVTSKAMEYMFNDHDFDEKNGRNLVINLRMEALPIVCCVVCASAFAPEHKSTVIMAACIASSVCSGSILGGLLAGWMVAWLVGRLLFTCIRLGIPATMTNILVAGGSGAIVASFLSCTGVVRALSYITEFIRSLVQSNPLHFTEDLMGGMFSFWDGKTGWGFIFGCIFCYGSKVGWYHEFFLPIILIEMERGKASLWGAIDECTLVLVSAGICTGNIVLDWILSNQRPTLSEGDIAISKRGLRINILCGDFIEVAYPFMERSWIVNYTSYLACGIATEILYRDQPEKVLSSAYMPIFFSIWLSDDWKRMGLACFVAFGISFIGSIIGNYLCSSRKKEKKGAKQH